jgi:hypothetical protein
VTRSMAVTVAPTWIKLSSPERIRREVALYVCKIRLRIIALPQGFFVSRFTGFYVCRCTNRRRNPTSTREPISCHDFPGPRAPQQHRGGLALIDLDMNQAWSFRGISLLEEIYGVCDGFERCQIGDGEEYCALPVKAAVGLIVLAGHIATEMKAIPFGT